MRAISFMLLVGVVGFAVGCGKKAPTTAPDKVAAGPENKTPTTTTDPANKTPAKAEPAPAGKSDKELLQGVWAVESIERGNGEIINNDAVKSVRYQFNGDKILYTMGKGTVPGYMMYSVDSSKSPKWMTPEKYDKAGNPTTPVSLAIPSGGGAPRKEKSLWVYQLDGNNLVIAMTERDYDGYRPTELKSSRQVFPKFDDNAPLGTKPEGESRPEINLWRLKRTNEPPFPEVALPPNPAKK